MLSDVDVLRVGRISYLNTLPFYAQTSEEESWIQWQPGTPAELNDKMRRGELDIALVSSLEYAQAQQNYQILRPGCIATQNQSDSVVLVSQKPIEKLNGETVALCQESLSSSALLQILFQSRFSFRNPFIQTPNSLEAIFSSASCGLLIGDSALLNKQKAPYVYDLGVLWKQWTKTPFCFALWVVREQTAKESPEEVARFQKYLTSVLHRNLSHLGELAKKAVHLNPRIQNTETVRDYFSHLVFLLDSSIQRGVLEFFKRAHAINLAPKCNQLKFFGENS